MSIIVFYLAGLDPQCNWFRDDELTPALARVEELRKLGHSHVTIASDLAGSVGKPGVSSVENGKTPDGHDYEWSKQHRGGPPRKD